MHSLSARDGVSVLTSFARHAVEKVVYFLTQANECLTMACRTRNESMRDRLVKLADEWTDMAVERERMVAKEAKEPASVWQ